MSEQGCVAQRRQSLEALGIWPVPPYEVLTQFSERREKRYDALLPRKTPRIMSGRPTLRACVLVFRHGSSSIKLDLVDQAND